jgi:hypothetical protein
MTINTALMFPLQPDWQGPTMDSNVERIGTMIDSKTGRAKSRLNSILPNYKKRFEFVLTGSECETARTWMETYFQGKWKAFWMPSWISDFPIDSVISSGATSFTTHGIARYSRWALAHGRRTVVAILPNGSMAYANVTSITGTAYGQETVNILSSFGVTIPVNSLMCWLMWGRCDQDDFEIEWQDGTYTLATWGFDFIELPWEQPEAIT